MTKLLVVRVDIHQGDKVEDQRFTVGKIYETDDVVSNGSIFVNDDGGRHSALFNGEFEVINDE